MIHIDRDKIPEPEWLRGPTCEKLRQDAAGFFQGPPEQREQARFSFEMGVLRNGVRVSLTQLFAQKCAFCEQKLDVTPEGKGAWDLEQFRPKQLGGDDTARDHYWWLCYAWENLYVACESCNRNKRNLFPISGRRCDVGSKGEALLAEKALLIDPCAEQPEDYLFFDDEATAASVADFISSLRGGNPKSTRTRAETTIELYELNRAGLLQRRRERIMAAKSLLTRCLAATEPNRMDERTSKGWQELEQGLADEAEFAAAQRWACARQLIAAVGDGAEEVARSFLSRVSGLPNYLRHLRELPPQERGRARKLPLFRPPATPEFVRAAVVSQASLWNYRIIKRLNFNVQENRPAETNGFLAENADRPTERGWKMFLGENGSGKTSVLHALALALMGQEFYEENKGKYWLAGNLGHNGARGHIQVWLSGDAKPIHLRILSDRIQWLNGQKGANVFLRGYGASRLLPKRDPRNASRAQPARENRSKNVDNLFDPFAPLIDAEAWLRALDDVNYRQAAINLKDVLDIKKGEGELEFEEHNPRRKGRFGLSKGKGKRKHLIPLEHFSAGYQTLLALACDIMAGSGKNVEDMISAPGVILVDEIGTNLHPRWRMEIVARLRKTFPAMQFIASTHEPLCLRGLGQGEVAVMRLDRGCATLLDDLPSPAGLRVDQLLTSEFFGLNTTIDPQTEKEFGIYYDLLEREHSLREEEKSELARLRNELAGKSVLGSSRRDRLILDIIDKFLVTSSAAQRHTFPQPTADVIRQVGEVLKEIEPLKRFVP